MEYKFIEKDDYHKNKEHYLKLINDMYHGDDNKLANINEIEQHLDFIFNKNYNNNAFLILQLESDCLISMVNFYEYNNQLHEWCLFSLFVNRNFRRNGYGEQTIKYALEKIKEYECEKLISGIEKDNISSIRLHEKVGFKYTGYNWDQLADGFPKDHLGFIYDNNK